MKKLKEVIKAFVCKHGYVIASCAFAFVILAANSQCLAPFYEPEEPNGIEQYKKF